MLLVNFQKMQSVVVYSFDLRMDCRILWLNSFTDTRNVPTDFVQLLYVIEYIIGIENDTCLHIFIVPLRVFLNYVKKILLNSLP